MSQNPCFSSLLANGTLKVKNSLFPFCIASLYLNDNCRETVYIWPTRNELPPFCPSPVYQAICRETAEEKHLQNLEERFLNKRQDSPDYRWGTKIGLPCCPSPFLFLSIPPSDPLTKSTHPSLPILPLLTCLRTNLATCSLDAGSSNPLSRNHPYVPDYLRKCGQEENAWRQMLVELAFCALCCSQPCYPLFIPCPCPTSLFISSFILHLPSISHFSSLYTSLHPPLSIHPSLHPKHYVLSESTLALAVVP